MSSRERVIKSFLLFFWAIFLLFGPLGCTFKTQEVVNPQPCLLDQNSPGCVKDGVFSIQKSFFGIKIDEAKRSISDVNKNKKWICGWSPLKQLGLLKTANGFLNTPLSSRNCNLIFNISKDGENLVGRLVNPDKSDFYDWTPIIEIPILNHYYYQKDRDANGREANRYGKIKDIENWHLRPYIDLDLKRVRLIDERISETISDSRVSDVGDIEVERKEGKNFLGFTARVSHNALGGLVQTEFRFNFLEFQGTKGFKKRTYTKSMSEYVNFVHVLGNRPHGTESYLYAARWDFSQPIEVCLNNFPEDSRNYKQVAIDSVEELNKVLVKAGAIPDGTKAFVVSNKKYKHAYDIRCTSISWVDDTEISLTSPTGIGLVHTDVLTGEILWGGAVIWGGLIDYVYNNEAPILENESFLSKLSSGTPFSGFEYTYEYGIKDHFKLDQWDHYFKPIHQKSFFSERPGLESRLARILKEDGIDEIPSTPTREGESSRGDSSNEFFSRPEFDLDSDHLVQNLLEDVLIFSEENLEKENLLLKKSEKTNLGLNDYLKQYRNGPLDMGNSLSRQSFEIQTLLSELHDGDRILGARKLIKETITHELGHIVGLGHHFSAGLRPARGTVPDDVHKTMKEEYDEHGSSFTSVMYYPSVRSSIKLPYDKIQFRLHDEWALRLLYTGYYNSYRPGDDKFVPQKLEDHGVIPRFTEKDGIQYETNFLHFCTDIDAVRKWDPYCNRFADGYDAPTMVEHNIERLKGELKIMKSHLGATGGHRAIRERQVYRYVYNFMNKSRAFYDHMRHILNPISVNKYGKKYNIFYNEMIKSQETLYSFEKACISPVEVLAESSKKEKIMENFAEISLKSIPGTQKKSKKELLKAYKDVVGTAPFSQLDFDKIEEKLHVKGVDFTEVQRLCRATKKALEFAEVELTKPGSDYTITDFDDELLPSGMPGGNAKFDFSHEGGTYKEIGRIFVKLPILQMLTTTSSTMRIGYYDIPKEKFNNTDAKYSYESLYPERFHEILSKFVHKNMNFATDRGVRGSTMSPANFYLAYFLNAFKSNDNETIGFNRRYIRNLKNQLNIQVRQVAVMFDHRELSNIEAPPNTRFDVTATLVDPEKGDREVLGSAYFLPDRNVIVRGNLNQTIIPVSELQFLNQDRSFIWAMEVTFGQSQRNKEIGMTVKTTFQELLNKQLNECLGNGEDKYGLSSFFKSSKKLSKFKGFRIAKDIARNPDAQDDFEDSVDEAFAIFNSDERLNQKSCDDSIQGIKLIGASALSLKGILLPYEVTKN